MPVFGYGVVFIAIKKWQHTGVTVQVADKRADAEAAPAFSKRYGLVDAERLTWENKHAVIEQCLMDLVEFGLCQISIYYCMVMAVLNAGRSVILAT